MEILDRKVKESGYELADTARARAGTLFEAALLERRPSFGNARLARTVFEQACVSLADRLEHDPTVTRDELTIIQEADIQVAHE